MKAAVAGLAVAAVALPALTTILLSESESIDARSVATSPAEVAGPKAPSTLALRREASNQATSPVGLAQEHTFRFASRLAQGEALMVQLSAGGTQVTTCYRRDATGTIVGVRFNVTTLQLDGLKPEVKRQVRAGLAAGTEVLLDLDPQQRLRGLALLDPPANALVRDQLRSWATHPHLVLGADRTYEAWGWDALGEARDTYTLEGDVLERTRTLTQRGPLAPRLEGSLRAEVRAGRIAALVGREVVGLELGRGATALTREVTLDLIRTREAAPGRLHHVRSRLTEVDWERELLSEANSSERPAKALAELLPRLKQGKGSLRELARTLRSAPGAVAQAVRLFPTLSEAAQRRLLGALGGADTSEAQRALLGLAKGDLPEALLPSAFTALGTSTFPFPETIDFFSAQSRLEAGSERQRWGTLGLGLVARRAAEEDAANRATIHLTENLDGEQARSEKLVTLSAIGNGGREVAFEAVAGHVDDEDAEVRARALFALRHVDVEEAQLLLRNGALADRAASVRREAIHGLTLRGPTPDAVATLTQALRQDTSAEVRVEAAAGVSNWLALRSAELDVEQQTALRGLLQEAQRDANEAVRDTAQAGLRG